MDAKTVQEEQLIFDIDNVYNYRNINKKIKI